MSGNNAAESGERTPLDLLVDIAVTLTCWGYFLFAFLFFFSFFYLAAYLFSGDRERSFQFLNHLFFRGFMLLLRGLAPSHSWDIDPRVSSVRSSIIVCNHLSYLDPLVFLSLLSRNKTIVKTNFFSSPVFGRLIYISGYLPATTEGRYGARMVSMVEEMGEFLRSGGVLFVFPEGTRSRNGDMVSLHKGVFKIARMYKCSVTIMGLCGTDRLFTPGEFFFHTRRKNRIVLRVLETVVPKGMKGGLSINDLEDKVRTVLKSSKVISGEC